MQTIYTLSIWLYGLLIRFAALFNSKASQFKQGREGIFERMQADFAGNQAPVVWFHCASLGEFEQGRPVIELFKTRFPTYKVLLTFFSPSGYEVRKNYPEADWIYYLPLDLPSNARQFVTITQPKIALFVKYEFWHHYLSELQRAGTPVLSISSIFREEQVFFKPFGAFHREILKKVDHFFVQTARSAELLKEIGLTNATVTGDTRFDRVQQISEQRKPIPLVEKFVGKKPCLIVGSAWKADLEVIAPVLNQFEHPLKLVIAPHEIGPSNLKLLASYFPQKNTLRYSEATESNVKKAEVLMIDNIGLLSSLYYYGDFAFIGGAYGAGLHNTLEACVFGLPLFFGNKKYLKFQEAVDLIARKGAFPIASSQEFEREFSAFYHNERLRRATVQSNLRYVAQNLGASGQIVDYCERFR